jgi:hypothetical protein
MAGPPGPEKYAPLAAFLTAQPPTAPTVTLTLPEVEQLLGRPLPAGAWARTWWQGQKGRGRPWLAAGWRVAGTAMRLATPTVTFVRVVAAAPVRGPASAAQNG